MKKVLFLCASLLFLFSCTSSKKDLEAPVGIHFSHFWDSTSVSTADFNSLKFITENGEKISIERLRYLVSNVMLTDANNNTFELSKYQLINLGENQIDIPAIEVPLGTYRLSFIFGFTDAQNTDGSYPDLNSASFNVPTMLGGGYHYMQFDGKYIGQNLAPAPFNYHAIRAVNRENPNAIVFQDTSFKVELGVLSVKNSKEIEVKMNIAEWFKNPNIWDLNQRNTVLMPNFEAQLLMSQNGKSVFSLGDPSQYIQ